MNRAEQLAPYQRLVELAETECALAQAGQFDQLDQLQAEWQELLSSLPRMPPAGAEPSLQRALVLSQQAAAQLIKACAEVQRELGSVEHTRAVGRAYTPPTATPAARSIDTAA